MSGDCETSKSSCCGESHDEVKTISREELQEKLKQGGVQVLNVLEPEWHKLGSIPGSRKIPVSQLEKRLGEVDKSKEVVTYCAGPQCSASREGAKKLASKGYNVRAYEGGIKDWKAAGLKVEEAGESGGCCGG